jgi:RNA polymerase primary sigma factor
MVISASKDWRRNLADPEPTSTMRNAHEDAARSTTLLDVYLQEIREDGLLTAEEETMLARAIAAGDKDALARMIKSNLRLVVKIALEYTNRGLVLEDLVGEGNLGLIRAAKDFDPAYGTRFSTYASYWIKQAIRHALTNTTATIRLPAHMVGLITKWRRAERALAREFRQAPSDEQIAVHLGLTDAQLELVFRARRASRLQHESTLNADGKTWSPEESTDDRESTESTLEKLEEQKHLLQRLDRLDDRERAILSLRFGLSGEGPKTLKEVGKRMGVTREWVRKIELKALKRLESDDAPPPKPVRSNRVQAALETRNRRRTNGDVGATSFS